MTPLRRAGLGRAAAAALLAWVLAAVPGAPVHAQAPPPDSVARPSQLSRPSPAPAKAPAAAPEGAGVSAPAADLTSGLIDFSPAELARISHHGPWPPAPARDAGNRYAGRPDAIALGRRLFFDSRLSASGTVACASCHQPGLAFADARARSVGLAQVDRNSPSLWNAVHERWFGWDGAADSLWSQAIRPLLDPREMGGSAALLRRVVAADVDLACRYRRVVGRELSSAAAPADDEALLVDAAKSIAAYVGSLVSGRTAFDVFRDALLRGDHAGAAAYPLAAQRGLQLFVGRAGCGNCHVGAMFSNGEFADIGRPFFIRPGVVDPGRQGGIAALRASRYHLLSAWADDTRTVASAGGIQGTTGTTGTSGAARGGDPPDAALKIRHLAPQHRNFGEFKVPSLRNVALTAPYLHDGSLATLDEVLTHYSELDLERLHGDGEQLLRPLHFSVAERADLLAFLHTLSDPLASVEPVFADPPCIPEASLPRHGTSR